MATSPPEGAAEDSGPACLQTVHALRIWLSENPTAVVAAVNPADGQPVSMPDGVPLLPTHRIDDRSLLELVVPEDASRVVTAFVDALQHGVAVAEVRATGVDERYLTVHYLDLRGLFGVVLRAAVVDTARSGSGPSVTADLEAATPRLAVIEKDSLSTISAVDEATTAILGWPAADMVGHATLEFIHPEDHPRAIDNWMRFLRTGDRHSVRMRMRHQNGGCVWMETSNTSRIDPDGTRTVVTQMIDISTEMATTEALRHSEQLLRRVTETVPIGLVEIGLDRSYTYMNVALTELLHEYGLNAPEQLDTLLPDGDRSLLEAAVTAALRDGRDSDIEVRLVRTHAVADRMCKVAVRAVLDGIRVLSAVLCVTDITELKVEAATDALTGLANRSGVLAALIAALGGTDPIGLIYVDLDGFKSVNDRFGHQAGDELLCHVARQLRTMVREGDTVGRLGGDEFVVVCPHIATERDLMDVTDRIHAALSAGPTGLRTDGCIASVGAIRIRPRTTTPEAALAAADEAMYTAKRARQGAPGVAH